MTWERNCGRANRDRSILFWNKVAPTPASAHAVSPPSPPPPLIPPPPPPRPTALTPSKT